MVCRADASHRASKGAFGWGNYGLPIFGVWTSWSSALTTFTEAVNSDERGNSVDAIANRPGELAHCPRRRRRSVQTEGLNFKTPNFQKICILHIYTRLAY